MLILYWVGNAAASQHVGSEVCSECHFKEYNEFVTSGHPYILLEAAEAKKRPIPLPEGYTWDDISYVVGGDPKKARYVDKKGYILTAGKDGSKIKNQFNVETGTWSFFKPQEKIRYKCAKCHTTGYKKNGHQDGTQGIVGTWELPGVQCEACHGAASEHVKNKDSAKEHKLKIDKSSASCGQCHLRGEPNKIQASGGFVRSREQYSEILSGPHAKINCVKCHNQHKSPSVSGGIKENCKSCHKEQATQFKNNIHSKVGIRCIDCHMPRAGKGAVTTSAFEGDLRTHLVKINTDPNAAMFSKDGKSTTGGYVTLDFACLNCHRDKDKKWAAAGAARFHRKIK
jgi:formate-dependent nitrite reductase cytochrome c552 subunit